MSLPDGEAPGAGRTEDKVLQELTRRLTQVEQFANGLHAELPPGKNSQDVGRWVRDRLLAILDGR